MKTMIETRQIPGFPSKQMKAVESESSWRLVHNGIRAITLVQSSGKTWTPAANTVFTAETKAECVTHGNGLGLDWGTIDISGE